MRVVDEEIVKEEEVLVIGCRMRLNDFVHVWWKEGIGEMKWMGSGKEQWVLEGVDDRRKK